MQRSSAVVGLALIGTTLGAAGFDAYQVRKSINEDSADTWYDEGDYSDPATRPSSWGYNSNHFYHSNNTSWMSDDFRHFFIVFFISQLDLARRIRLARARGRVLKLRRVRIQPRPNWQATVESLGFHFHTVDERPYWDESAYYEFTTAEIDAIEKATYELDKMCLAAVQHIIDENLFDRFQIPPAYVPWVKTSWDRDEHTIYGRFDLCFSGLGEPKLLEYNADTPTSLLEAAVVQWNWMKERFPNLDQFNSIHERLIEEHWAAVRPTTHGKMYFTCIAGNLDGII